MKDRVPASGKAGHVLLTPASGGSATEYILAMADNPSSGNEGTPLNKASLLTDATFANIKSYLSVFNPLNGVSNDGVTVDQILNLVGQHGLRFKYGSFVGTCAATQGEKSGVGVFRHTEPTYYVPISNINLAQTLTVGFAPIILIIYLPGSQIGSPTSAATDDRNGSITGSWGHWSMVEPPRIWFRGNTYGYVGIDTINTSAASILSGTKTANALLQWTNTGVTWQGGCRRTWEYIDDGVYHDSDSKPWHSWYYLYDCFNLIGNTYYYIAIG